MSTWKSACVRSPATPAERILVRAIATQRATRDNDFWRHDPIVHAMADLCLTLRRLRAQTRKDER